MGGREGRVVTDVDVLLLRLEAPLMSFGGAAVDEQRITRQMPALSMLTGLLANALGWHHTDVERLDRLQQRLQVATRRDKAGTTLVDFQTVDLGQDFLRETWTSRGRPESRGGGNASGTHIRYRHFLADAAYTVALTLEPAAEAPTLDELEAALLRPARPLWIGRKSCLPARPLLGDPAHPHRVQAPTVLAALVAAPPAHKRRRHGEPAADEWAVWWRGEPRHQAVRLDRTLPITDTRDWQHQIHVGQRLYHEGVQLAPPTVAEEDSHG